MEINEVDGCLNESVVAGILMENHEKSVSRYSLHIESTKEVPGMLIYAAAYVYP